ncbi:AEC family transporter [Kaustia mangrovi]|uniref:AEC family transporter n=1 Tax=Kaustia mangrovi TaxID=2593653 RepID=A0A7S8C171_9HYPH|nr:AEC family transporter [Kaustia mangrovi]QPC41407.1 AEC family transporter [Kaustia mangrovi]
MGAIINLALPFFGLILLGYIAARMLDIEEKGLAWLNALVVYLCVPALIFQTVANAPFEKLANWQFILATTLSTYLVYLTAFAVAVYVLGQEISRGAIQGAAASYGNVGYIGLPLCVTAFGPEATVPAALIFCFDSILQFTATPLIVAFGVRQQNQDVTMRQVGRQIVRTIFTHPFIVATLAGILASALSLDLPGAIDNLLEMLVGGAAPAALFALGVTLALRRFTAIGREFPVLVILKTIVHPVLVFILVGAIASVDVIWLHVALLMAALPTAANVFVLATQFRSYVEGASSTILVTTIVAAGTIPALLYLMESNLLP